jgi:hypothetical protein
VVGGETFAAKVSGALSPLGTFAAAGGGQNGLVESHGSLAW